MFWELQYEKRNGLPRVIHKVTYLYQLQVHNWTRISHALKQVTPKKRNFLSSPINSLYWAKLLTEVPASKVHAIPRNQSPKKPKILHRQAQFWNKCSVARPGQAAKREVVSFKLFYGFLCKNAILLCPGLAVQIDPIKIRANV